MTVKIFEQCTNKISITAYISLLLIVLSSCGESSKYASSDEAKILASVNDTPITQLDVDRAIVEQLGPGTLRIVDDKTRLKILKGLVTTRALALTMQKELNDRQRLEVDKAVHAYRDLLLAKRYIALKSKDLTITDEMLKSYYNEHPKQFGQATIKHYGLLKGIKTNDMPKMQRILTTLKSAREKSAEEWKKFNRDDNDGITFFEGKLEDGIFAPRLQAILETMKPGEVSNIVFVNGMPYLGRLTTIQETEAKPFSQVRNDVMKYVRMIETKKVVSSLKAEVMSNNKIDYYLDSTKK